FVRGRKNVLKRLQLHAAAANLGIVMRKILGAGTPRSLQGRRAALLGLFPALMATLDRITLFVSVSPTPLRLELDLPNAPSAGLAQRPRPVLTGSFSTGC